MAPTPPSSPLEEEDYVTVHRDGSAGHKVEYSVLTFGTDDGILSHTSDFACSEDSYSIVDYYYLSTGLPVTCANLAAMAAVVPAQMSSKVTDWVKQQACEDTTANNVTHDPKPTNPAKTLFAVHGSSRRYDVETLLQLRYTVNMSDVKLQINPEVLQGKQV